MAEPPKNQDESFAALFESSGGARAPRKRYRTGERVDVKIVAIGRDAVFADLGGKEEGIFDRVGLVDGEGKLTVEVGASVAAVVTSIDDASGQIKLSPVYVRRAPRADEGSYGGPGGIADDEAVTIPRAASAPLIVEGARVRGKVTGIERYGVFVQLGGTTGRGGRGLVPSSETGTPRGADLKKHFVVGQDIEAKIMAIGEDGKIRLSVSALAADEERASFETFAKSEREETKKGNAKPVVRGFGTMGDLFSRKK